MVQTLKLYDVNNDKEDLVEEREKGTKRINKDDSRRLFWWFIIAENY